MIKPIPIVNTKDNQFHEFALLQVPYMIYWSQWLRSGYFSDKEVIVLEGFRCTKSHDLAVELLHLSSGRIEHLFKKIKNKLKYSVHVYKQWVGDYKRQKYPFVYSDNTEKFLYSSIKDHGLSHRVISALSALDCEYMNDLSKHSIKDMRRLRNFGKESIEELKDLLRINNCLHLLK